jgi:hypothetical protein
MRNFVFRSSLVLAALALLVPTAHADELSLTFNSSTSFSGIATAGSLSAVFVVQSNGTVLLTLTSNLATGENLDRGKAWYFNFNPVNGSSTSNSPMQAAPSPLRSASHKHI